MYFSFNFFQIASLAFFLFCTLEIRQTEAQLEDSDHITSNLLRNGDFEDGVRWPESWEPVDQLTVWWVEETSRGMILQMDSDVLQEDFLRRQEEMVFESDSAVWQKRPTREPKFNTIGGNEGVKFLSAPVPVKLGMKYLVRCDNWTDGGMTPKLFVRGYGVLGGRERKLYDTYVNCLNAGNEWTKQEQDFNPTLRTPAVTRIRVMLFAYWKPGIYRWDNIEIVEAGMDERFKPLKDDSSKPKTRLAIHFEEDDENKEIFALMDQIEEQAPKSIWIETVVAKEGKIIIRCLADNQLELEKYQKLLEQMVEIKATKQKRIRAVFRQESNRQVFEALIEVEPKGL